MNDPQGVVDEGRIRRTSELLTNWLDLDPDVVDLVESVRRVELSTDDDLELELRVLLGAKMEKLSARLREKR